MARSGAARRRRAGLERQSGRSVGVEEGEADSTQGELKRSGGGGVAGLEGRREVLIVEKPKAEKRTNEGKRKEQITNVVRKLTSTYIWSGVIDI